MRTDSIRKIIRQNWQTLSVALYVGLFLGLVVLLSSRAAPIADDFRLLRPNFPIISYLYNTDSGRVSHGLSVAINWTLFGDNVVKVFPPLLVSTFIASVALLFFSVFRNNRSVLGGAVFSVLAMVSMHSFFDFSLFFSAATAHSIALIYLLLLSSFLIYASRSTYGVKWYLYIPVFIACLLGGMLTELAALLGCVIALFFVLLSFIRNTPQTSSIFLEFFKSIKTLHLVIISANIISFLVIYFSPGSITRRQSSETGSNITAAFQNPFADYIELISHFFISPTNILPILCGALILYLLLVNSGQYDKRASVLSMGFLFVLPFLIFFTTNYSLSYTAMRMYNLADFVFLLATSSLLAHIGYISLKRNNTQIPNRLSLVIACAILGIISLFSFATRDAANIYKAEGARTELLNYRADKISDDLRLNASSVSFMPAPLLLTNTEAIDMTYYPNESPESTWLYGHILNYYRIPPDSTVTLSSQPVHYCINTDVLSRFKEVLAKKCGTY